MRRIRVDKQGMPCHCQRVRFSYMNHWLKVTWVNGRVQYFECDDLIRTGVGLLQGWLSREQLMDAYAAAERYAQKNMYTVYGPERVPSQVTVH